MDGIGAVRRAGWAWLLAILLIMAGGVSAAAAQPPAGPATRVQTLKVTVLSTMLADGDAIGEWGYSALVEVDGRRFLFDTGANPDTVLRNAKALHIDLAQVEDVVITHNHDDHTGGLLALRRALMTTNPRAMSRVHVGAGVFEPRLGADGRDDNGLAPIRQAYEASGGRFILYDRPAQLAPGVWITGPVPRPNDETNWQPGLKRRTASGLVDDTVPEDFSLVFATSEGLVILTGCGHAGVVNIAQYAAAFTGLDHILALVGGVHLFAKSDAVIAWTAAKLKPYGVRYLLAGHCTGIEATYRLRALLGLDRKTAVVSAVGSAFVLGEGIKPGEIAA